MGLEQSTEAVPDADRRGRCVALSVFYRYCGAHVLFVFPYVLVERRARKVLGANQPPEICMFMSRYAHVCLSVLVVVCSLSAVVFFWLLSQALKFADEIRGTGRVPTAKKVTPDTGVGFGTDPQVTFKSRTLRGFSFSA